MDTGKLIVMAWDDRTILKHEPLHSWLLGLSLDDTRRGRHGSKYEKFIAEELLKEPRWVCQMYCVMLSL
jgi:hypothetical protein